MNQYTLHIQNFQIISDCLLTFKPGVTLLTGHSNNGKSSIIKAFKQLIYNTSGTDYIKHHTPKTTITLTYNSNEYTITYTKSPTESQCLITTPNSTEKFTKLGSQQLPQVKDITHIDKELNYNFWSQLEKPFLISLSPKEQFDYLQQSPHTHTLQSILQQMQQDRKQHQSLQASNQSKLELIQQQNNSFQNQLQQLPILTSMFTQITTLKDQNNFLSTIQNTLNKYNSININHIQSQLNKFQSLPTISTQFTDLNQKHTNLSQLNTQFTKLIQTTQPINQIQQQISDTKINLERINLFLQQHFTICPLCNQPFNNH